MHGANLRAIVYYVFTPTSLCRLQSETIVFLVVVMVAYAIAYLTGILMNTVTVANIYGGSWVTLLRPDPGAGKWEITH